MFLVFDGQFMKGTIVEMIGSTRSWDAPYHVSDIMIQKIE